MSKLSFTLENYLEAIYELSKDGYGARVSDIATSLDVTKASTTSAMASLADKGLITYQKYREIRLTPKGLELAKKTSHKHEIIQQFFEEVLKITPSTADTDACAIEHVISKESVDAMIKYLKNIK